MGLIILFILFLVYLVITIRGVVNRSLFSPSFIFSLVWTIILGSYLIYYDNYYDITFKAALLLFLGSISFLLGSSVFLYKGSRSHVEKISEKKEFCYPELREAFFFLFSIITIVAFWEKALVNTGYLILGLNFNDIYLMSLNENNDSRNFFITVATMFIAGPFVYVVIPIIALEFTRPNRRWWIITLSIIILLLSVLQTGRRSMLLYFVVGFVYMLFSNSDFFKLKGKTLKLFLFTGLFIGLLLSLVSWISSQRDTSFKETGYVYFGGGIAGFSNRIERIDNIFFGAATLHGTMVPVMIANKYLTKSYPTWWKELDALVEAADEIKIGPNEYMNAFTTMFYVPYIDFGWIGIVLIPLVLGIIYRKYYRSSKLNLNSTSRIVYSLLIIGLAGSMYTLYVTQSPYILSFLYVPLLFKNK